jgi:predicted enzyme related to lactoylglutathione lyase
VDDIDGTMARLSVSGGQQGAVRDIAGTGRFGYAIDSEGNVIALLQRAP